MSNESTSIPLHYTYAERDLWTTVLRDRLAQGTDPKVACARADLAAQWLRERTAPNFPVDGHSGASLARTTPEGDHDSGLATDQDGVPEPQRRRDVRENIMLALEIEDRHVATSLIMEMAGDGGAITLTPPPMIKTEDGLLEIGQGYLKVGDWTTVLTRRQYAGLKLTFLLRGIEYQEQHQELHIPYRAPR